MSSHAVFSFGDTKISCRIELAQMVTLLYQGVGDVGPRLFLSQANTLSSSLVASAINSTANSLRSKPTFI